MRLSFTKSILLLLMSCLLGAASQAQPFDKTIPFQQALCRLGNENVKIFLRFDKKLSPEENDYSGAPLIFLKFSKAKAAEPVNKESADFSFIKPGEASICDKTQGYKINDDVLAILYSKDNRPFRISTKSLFTMSTPPKFWRSKKLGPSISCSTKKVAFLFPR